MVQYQPTPDAREPVIDDRKTADGKIGLAKTVWYRFFSDVWRRATAMQTDIDALQLHTSTLGTYTALSSTTTTLTGIPTNARMVILNIVGMIWNNTAAPRIRIGPSGGVATSGYLASGGFINDPTAISVTNATGGFDTVSQGAAAVYHGSIVLTLADAATNTWACSGTLGRSDAGVFVVNVIGGSVPLSGALERVVITTVAGTATADAGSASLLVYS